MKKVTQSSITVALKAAINAGLTVYGYKVTGNVIEVNTVGESKDASDEVDKWLLKNGST